MTRFRAEFTIRAFNTTVYNQARDVLINSDLFLQEQQIARHWLRTDDFEGYVFKNQAECDLFLLMFGNWFHKIQYDTHDS